MARALFLMLMCLAGRTSYAVEQTAPAADEDALKVAFIYNFAKFTQWPALAVDAPITICIFGRIEFQRQLASVDGKRVGQRPVAVRYLTDLSKVSNCQMLYIGKLERNRRTAALGAARPFPILTISDTPDFARDGGMVEIFPEHQRLRLRINKNKVEAAGVRLSSKVLKLAIIVS